jgi:hypothetical protein
MGQPPSITPAAMGERGGVVQVGRPDCQLAGAFVRADAPGWRVAKAGGTAADADGNLGCLGLEDLGGWWRTQLSALGSPDRGNSRRPLRHAHHDVDEVADDTDRGAAAGGLGLDRVDLLPVPVHQGDPSPLAVRVTAPGLAEPGGHDGGHVAGDAGCEPFLGCGRAALARESSPLPGERIMSPGTRGTGMAP